mmetsp:Transcript_133742/g.415972  ORF Transcript_133742/g.415972 Transcript_133742/m.415972 type:complete len:184 (+) Transcript_133742:126-677(+)
MWRLLRRYNSWVMRRPYVSATVSTGCILGSGDIMMQRIETAWTPEREFDWPRLLRMSSYGWGVLGPGMAVWYNQCLPRLVVVPKGSETLRTVLWKVLYDQALWAPVFYAVFLYVMTRMEFKSHGQAVEKVKRDFWTCYFTELLFWPGVMVANFMYMPAQMQPIVVSTLLVFWSAFLSWVQSWE